ncbi:MAG: WXG100 family type VII secretion target [Pseudonocardiaceae bacterium]
MTEPGLHVRSHTMRTAAGAFAREGPALSEALTRLRSALDGLGEPWGDDDPGTSFGSGYKPNAQALMNALGTLVEGLTTTGEGLGRMASNYDGSDAASTIPGS